jgi:hypothetical protein
VERKRREKAERYTAAMDEAITQRGIQIDHRKRPREKVA